MFMVYAWILEGFFWKLPSWLYHLTPGEILGALGYMLLHGLAESLLMLGLLLLLAALLPGDWLRDAFAVRGTILAAVALGSIMVYMDQSDKGHLVDYFLPWLAITSLLALGLLFLSARVAFLGRVVTSLAERFTVFVYLQIPLVILAVIMILARNLVQA